MKLHKLIADLKQKATVELAYANCRPSFQHRYALSRLKQEGYQLAVCSNSIRSTVDLMMSLTRLRTYLDFFLSNEDVERAKPAPDIYTHAIGQLGVDPREVLIVEDNDHGIEAARRSGGHVMIVSNVDDVSYARIRENIDRVNREEVSTDRATA